MLSHARIRVALLTGDRKSNADATASALGIQDVFAEMTPEGKLAEIERLQKAGHAVAMVGDGFNDMPVLAGAHASFAVGQAVPLAQAKADVVVMGSSLTTVANTLALAQKTMKVVRHNLTWAAAYNAICVPLAFMGYLPAWLAGLGMALSSLLVVMNALRLNR